MRALIVLSLVVGVATAFAQSGSAGSAAPAAGSGSAGAGSAGVGSAGSGSAGAGSAGAGSAGSGSASSATADSGSASSGAPDPGPPAFTPAARQRICEQGLAKPPNGDTRFVTDAQSYALGQVAAPQLAKTPEGQACVDAINSVSDFRSAVSTLAQEREAARLAGEVELQHELAAKAIAKNQKHVVLAYAALWVLAAGFLLFLWRRQQALKVEIANLKRDLETATK